MSRRSTTFLRRLRSIPLVMVGGLILTTAAPLLVVITLATDLSRGRRNQFDATRLLAGGLAYVWCEIIGLLALLTSWLLTFGSRRRRISQAFAIQRWWARNVLGSIRAVYGITVDGTGTDALHPPFVLVARHSSIIDNLLPAWFISGPHRTHIRYVMKTELLWDPCLDVAGNRLRNHFVERGSGASEKELAALGRLAADLGDDEGLLIYPEGTRSTPDRRASALARLRTSGGRLAEMAAHFRHVMPPKPSGLHAILESTAAEVLVMAHRGLDGLAKLSDLWRGGLTGARVEVSFWRISRSQIPPGKTEQAEWLYGLWAQIDAWVNEHDPVPA
jgi:1-acyl-sn-glycerol-3-phosphate acyltransferase